MTQDTIETQNDQDTAGEVQDSSASFNADSEGSDSQESLQDLLSLEDDKKYKLGNETFTGKELREGYMRMKDYTQKTQRLSPIAKEQKYIENIDADLQAVMANPSLAQQFKQVYPQKYHFLVDRLTGGQGTPNSGANPQQQGFDPKQIQKLIQEQVSPYVQKFQTMEQQAFEKEVKAQEQWLDTMHSKYAQKFDLADPEIVEKKVMDLLEANKEGAENDPFFEPTRVDEQLFARIYEEVHKRIEGKFTKRTQASVSEQMKVNQKARDMGQGGGQAPQTGRAKPRSIAEATEAFHAHVSKI